ncbi:hypothetical protein Tco_0275762 [Tanacetum coccineum]
MVLQLGYTGAFEPLFYNYLRPLTTLDEVLYALECEENVCCLAALVISFKLIEVYIEHGFTAVNSYERPPPQNEKMQTPIPTPPGSIRTDLSSDMATFVELTNTHDIVSEVLRRSDLPRIMKKIDDALYAAVPRIAIGATNDHLKDNLPNIISRDLATRVPKMIEDLFKQHIKSIASHVHSSSKDSIASISDLKHSSRHRDQDDHPNDNPEGEKNSKRQKSTYGYTSTNVTTSSNPTSSYKSKVVHKPRTYAPQPPIQLMMILGPRYLYNKDLFFLRNGNTEARRYILSLHKIHATLFLEDDLYELLKRWSDEVIVKRNNDKFYTFVESDFMCLGKNGIEDMYYIYLRRRNDTSEFKQQTTLIKALIIFIKSCMIWERVYDFQLGIESYQIKINLTAPTITYPGIEKDPRYSIIDVPFVGIVYENNKKEKRAMDIDELQKFNDATLRRVLRKISVINMEAKHGIVKIFLSAKDKELMALLKEEIDERLKYRQHMHRWESFVNGRQIANYMFRIE